MPTGKPIKDGFRADVRRMLQRRGLDPKNFEMVKETYACVYIRDKRDRTIKILNKRN